MLRIYSFSAQFRERKSDIWQESALELARNCIALGFTALLDKAFIYSASPTGCPPALKIALNMDAQSCKEVSSPGHLLPTKDCTGHLLPLPGNSNLPSFARRCSELDKKLCCAEKSSSSLQISLNLQSPYFSGILLVKGEIALHNLVNLFEHHLQAY